MKKKSFLISLCSLSTLFGVITSVIPNSPIMNILAENERNPKSFTLGSNDQIPDLPDSNSVDTVVRTFSKDFSTFKVYRATKPNDAFVRLHAIYNGNISYLEKVERMNNLQSITVKLNYGAIRILTGNKKDSYDNYYDVEGTTEKTIQVRGDYIKIINISTEHNAIIKYITFNYGCWEPGMHEHSYIKSGEHYVCSLSNCGYKVGADNRQRVSLSSTSAFGNDTIENASVPSGDSRVSLKTGAKIALSRYANAKRTSRVKIKFSDHKSQNVLNLKDAFSIYINDSFVDLPNKEIPCRTGSSYKYFEYDLGIHTFAQGNNSIVIVSNVAENEDMYFCEMTYFDPNSLENKLGSLTTSEDVYTLEQANKANTTLKFGKWVYWNDKNNSDTTQCVNSTAFIYDHGTIQGKITTLKNNLYIRTQPYEYVENVQRKYVVSFSITASSRIKCWKENKVAMTLEKDVTTYATSSVLTLGKDDGGFQLQFKANSFSDIDETMPEEGVTIKISDIIITEITDLSPLALKSVADVYANKGQWFYHDQGKTGTDSFINADKNRIFVVRSSTTADYFLRIMPEAQAGNEVTISFKAKASKNFTFIGQISNNNKTIPDVSFEVTTELQEFDFTFTYPGDDVTNRIAQFVIGKNHKDLVFEMQDITIGIGTK